MSKRGRGRPRINPRTPEEWQEAVNAAYFALVLDSAFQYGLLEREDGSTTSGVDVDRCRRILEAGAKKGLTPAEDWEP